MPNKQILQKIWQIIECLKGEEVTKLSDLELQERVQQQVTKDLILTASEKWETAVYIKSRIPIIRDWAEIELILSSKNQRVA